jgi:hypothetical protein
VEKPPRTVDRAAFERVVTNLLNISPSKRSDQKIGHKKTTGKIIPPPIPQPQK